MNGPSGVLQSGQLHIKCIFRNKVERLSRCLWITISWLLYPETSQYRIHSITQLPKRWSGRACQETRCTSLSDVRNLAFFPKTISIKSVSLRYITLKLIHCNPLTYIYPLLPLGGRVRFTLNCAIDWRRCGQALWFG